MHPDGDLKGRVLLDDGSALRMPLTLRSRDPQAAVGRTLSPSINPGADGILEALEEMNNAKR